MGKNGKLTKHIVSNALRKSDNISEIAESLGVARINVYRAIKRWALDRPMRKPDNVTPEIVVPETSSAQPEYIETITEGPYAISWKMPNLGPSDFTGRFCGDVGRKRH